MSPLFHYLTPLLLPLFSLEEAKLVLGLNLQRILIARAVESVTGVLHMRIDEYRNGAHVGEENLSFQITDGIPDTKIVWRNYEMRGDEQGFLEITISSDDAIFRKIDLPVGYAAIRMQGYGALTVIPDAKFARPTIIKQIQETRTFCLVHTACRWDEDANYGTSVFFVNPYEKDIVATISTMDKKKKVKVGPKEALRVPLADVLDGKKTGTIMITGNNRIPAWIVNHSLGDVLRINNVDHLDLFRGDKTHTHLPLFAFVKSHVRRNLRRLGQVY